LKQIPAHILPLTCIDHVGSEDSPPLTRSIRNCSPPLWKYPPTAYQCSLIWWSKDPTYPKCELMYSHTRCNIQLYCDVFCYTVWGNKIFIKTYYNYIYMNVFSKTMNSFFTVIICYLTYVCMMMISNIGTILLCLKSDCFTSCITLNALSNHTYYMPLDVLIYCKQMSKWFTFTISVFVYLWI